MGQLNSCFTAGVIRGSPFPTPAPVALETQDWFCSAPPPCVMHVCVCVCALQHPLIP